LVSTVIKNWDKNNWLSSKSYILKFNIFLTKVIKLNSSSKILDIGCGRAKIIGSLSSKLKLKNRPLGIDLVSHKDKDKRVNFKKTDAISFFSTNKKKFDLITLMWTLCNTSNCLDIINIANKLLNKDGYIVIAESSRMLVPFKKPIQMYFGKGNPDIHPFHFSKNSLMNLLIINKFKPVYINRYIDSDYLLIIAKKNNKINEELIKLDNYQKVKGYFKRWYKESLNYKRELI